MNIKHIKINAIKSNESLIEYINFFNSSLKEQIKYLEDNIYKQINSLSVAQKSQIELIADQMKHFSNSNESAMENIRRFIQECLFRMQENNDKRLEQIRVTVEEKLQSTLEKRLKESFSIVSDRLEAVHKGLGEMQNLASGVGDLKKVLTNVKTKGIWGEVQLGAILSQIMLPEQYAENVTVKPRSQNRVEYAIKLPTKQDGSDVLLPIDAKFPLEIYQNLVAAQEACDTKASAEYLNSLQMHIKKSAKLISEKYIHPPHTVDFAIMFLPIEGMYAEVLRFPGIIEEIQSKYRVIITSPTTLSAILNSLQIGFKTLAIERRSGDIWRLFASLKPEFAKFSALLSKTRIKLDQASNAIEEAEAKTMSIHNKIENSTRDFIASDLDEKLNSQE
ncbi:MAG: DNA recombination protein RmuC [Proteobacteria bacterium]|nr:DNA recombination protein RmuC [Pseudomonadota bacterium]